MHCPHCNWTMEESETVKCSYCGEEFLRTQVKELEHLEYVSNWLVTNQAQIGAPAKELMQALEQRRSALQAQALRSPEDLSRELALVNATLKYLKEWDQAGTILGTSASGQSLLQYYNAKAYELTKDLARRQVDVPPLTQLEVLDYGLATLPKWADPALTVHLAALRQALLEPRPVPPVSQAKAQVASTAGAELPTPGQPETTPAQVTISPLPIASPEAKTAPEARPKEQAAPKPKRQPIKWGNIYEKAVAAVVSGALLRGLLYLGAFMIVVSATVLVVKFWDMFPTFLQVIFIFMVPTVFYLAGWLVGRKLKLPQASQALVGTGALLLAVDFAAIYKLGGLSINPYLYWLVTSLICSLVYTLTAWWMPGDFFDYIALVGGVNCLAALVRAAGLSWQWSIAATSAASVGMVAAAGRLRPAAGAWRETARALHYLPLVLLPAGMLLVLFIPGWNAFAPMAVYAMAAIGFALTAAYFPATRFVHAACWSAIAAVSFLLLGIRLPFEWYPAVYAVLAVVFVFTARFLYSRLGESFPLRAQYRTAIYMAGFGLAGLSVAGGLVVLPFDLWAGVCALALAAVSLAGWAVLFHRPGLVLVSGGLFLVPFSLALFEWFDIAGAAWVATGWAGLALAYLGIAIALRRTRPYASPLYLLALVIIPVLALFSVIMYRTIGIPFVSELRQALAPLGGFILVYLVAAVIHDRRVYAGLTQPLQEALPARWEKAIFLWPVGILLPVWIAVLWLSSPLQIGWVGAVLGGLGLVYAGLGQLLARHEPTYRLPLHVMAFGLAAVGVLAALAMQTTGLERCYLDCYVYLIVNALMLVDQTPLLVALYLAAAGLAVQAVFYRKVWITALAAVFFLWPFQLSLTLSGIPTSSYGLCYALLASLVYIPAGLGVEKVEQKLAQPLYFLGYCLSVLAVVAALAFQASQKLAPAPWFVASAPLVTSGLVLFCLYRFRQSVFAVAFTLTLAITYGLALSLLRISSDYTATAWMLLAFVYLVVGWLLNRAKKAAWYQPLGLPLNGGCVALGILSILLTASGTFAELSNRQAPDALALILPQAMAVVLACLAAGLYRSRWPLFVAAGLSFFPYTLAWSAYGPALATVEFAWPWMGWAMVLLLAAYALDRTPQRYSHGLYLVGYLLAAFALGWSLTDRLVMLFTLGSVILIALVSQLLIHFKRHLAFEDFAGLILMNSATVAGRTIHIIFLFIAGYAFPVWLFELLIYTGVPLAWRGLALAAVALAYIPAGLLLRQVKAEYAWPLFSAGYALTAIGALLAFDSLPVAIAVLCVDALIYVLSAYTFKQALWLYLSNILAPVIAILTLYYYDKLTMNWVAPVLMAFAYLYIAIGLWLDRQRRKSHASLKIQSFALSFYSLGYLLSLLALEAAIGEKFLALGVYSAGVLLFAFSAWVFREVIFLYPAAWLAVVPYYLVMTLLLPEARWYGLGWLPFILGCLCIGRFVFKGNYPLRPVSAAFSQPSMPYYLLAYTLSIAMVAGSLTDRLALGLALSAGTLLYSFSAVLFRRPAWLYPALLAAHLALLVFLSFIPSARLQVYWIALPFSGMTWVVALCGYVLSRRLPGTNPLRPHKFSIHTGGREINFSTSQFFEQLFSPSWARPLFQFVALDVILWQLVALGGYQTTVMVAIGNAILVALFAMLWLAPELAYAALGFSLLAGGAHMVWLKTPAAWIAAWFSATGLGLYLLARLLEFTTRQIRRGLADPSHRENALSLWISPLSTLAILLTSLTAALSILAVGSQTQATAVALAFCGALYLAIVVQNHDYWLGYLGVFLLECSWVLTLVSWSLDEPQLYAIPVGLYLLGVGYLEQRRGRIRFAHIIEGLGLAVLLGTTFIQSLNGAEGLPYFVLLLVESLGVFAWGAVRHCKVPFLTGIAVSILNVAAQTVILLQVYDINRWFIILGAGLLLVSVGVFVERQRENIVSRARVWRETLEVWN